MSSVNTLNNGSNVNTVSSENNVNCENSVNAVRNYGAPSLNNEGSKERRQKKEEVYMYVAQGRGVGGVGAVLADLKLPDICNSGDCLRDWLWYKY